MKKRVLIWIPLGSIIGRDVCRGVYRYTRLHTCDWEIMHVEPSKFPLETLATWNLDGIIGPFGRIDFARDAKKAARFCVNMHGGAPFNNLPQSGVNDESIGITAASYFMRSGFSHFGYFGFPGMRFSDDRWRGYKKHLAGRGKSSVQFHTEKFVFKPSPPKNYMQIVRPALEQWLLKQPKPFALFVIDDLRTDLVYSACYQVGLNIPEDIAILGVSDDDIYCQKNNPTLSSIQLPTQMAGYRAAQLMDRMLRGKQPPSKPLLLEPGTVVERPSTSLSKLHDTQVIAALRFITEHAAHGIGTEEIARAAGLSRRVLEKRFRILLNSSPQAEVRRAQIKQAKNALRETNLSLEEIAEATGLTSGNYLSQIFKKATGQTPGTYRRNFR